MRQKPTREALLHFHGRPPLGATLSLACINVQAEHYRPGQTVYVLADRSKTHYFKK